MGSANNAERVFFDDFVREKFSADHSEDTLDRMDRLETSGGYLGNILEWNVRYVVFQSMFDESMRIRDSFKTNSNKLKWKLFWFGLGNLVLMPFTFAFRIIFFFLENAEEMHSNKGDLFSFRQWTALAKLKFREFNELPHAFDLRMAMATKPATEFIDSFAKSPHVLILSELVSYISGSIVAVLLLLTLIDSSILLNIKLFNHELVWFLAIFSALLAVARAQLVYNDPTTLHEKQMNEIGRHTHYLPMHWQGRCHTLSVRDQFVKMYQPKLSLFIHEMLSVFTTPFILMFTLPNCVDQLLEFVVEYSDCIDGVGDICSFSRFDFERFETKLVASAMNTAPSTMVNDEHPKEHPIGLLAPMSAMPRNVSSASNVSAASNLSSVSSEDRHKHTTPSKP